MHISFLYLEINGGRSRSGNMGIADACFGYSSTLICNTEMYLYTSEDETILHSTRIFRFA